MKLSVIISTTDRIQLLTKTLKSLSSQTLSQDEFEVLVIVNGRQIDENLIYGSFKDSIQNLRIIYEVKPGLHNVRHRGLKEAKSDILVYTDDDVVADSKWLESIAFSFNDESIVLVGGPILPEYEEQPALWMETLWTYNQEGRYLGYYSLIDFGKEMKNIDPMFVWGCNFSIRKHIIKEAGGFHPDSLPHGLFYLRGDGESAVSEYIVKMKYKAKYHPDALVFHFVPKKRMTKEYLYQRAFLQGISNSYSDIRRAHSKENVLK